MYTAAQIIEQARRTTGTDSVMTQFSDANLLTELNLAYHDIERWAVGSFNGDLWFLEYLSDTIADQWRYQLWNFDKIKELGIKWDSTQTKFEELKRLETEYSEYLDDSNLVGTDKYFDIDGNYITLYPAPTEWVLQGLYAKVIWTLPDITVTATSDEVFPNCLYKNDFQELVIWGMRPRLYMLKGQLNEAQLARQDLDYQKWEVASKIRSNPWIQPSRRRSSLDHHFMR